METPPPVKPRERWLTDEELRRIWSHAPRTHRCFGPIVRLLIVTGQRREEIAGLQWDEVSREAQEMRLSGERTKNGEPSTIPLNDLAIDGKDPQREKRARKLAAKKEAANTFRSMDAVSGGTEFVFPAFHSFSKPISENTVNQALRRLGYGGVMTAHGFRSTASTLLNESRRGSPDAIERALAHEDKNAVRAAYNRTDYWDERVEMMQWWSDRLDALKASAK